MGTNEPTQEVGKFFFKRDLEVDVKQTENLLIF